MIFSLEDLITEIDREIMQRNILYPRRVKNGTLDAETAVRQMDMLRAVREILDRLREAQKSIEPPTFPIDNSGQ